MLGGRRTNTLGCADIIIVQDAAFNLADYRALREHHPAKRFIACLVWEMDQLPDSLLSDVMLADEVWTCSIFCRDVLRQFCDAVHVVPHVCELVGYGPSELAAVDRKIDRGSGKIRFYSILNEWILARILVPWSKASPLWVVMTQSWC